MNAAERRYAARQELPLFSAAARLAARQALGDERTESAIVSTGLASLDAALGGGLVRGTVTLCAGRPRVGTSSLVVGMALAASRRGEPAAILSESVSARQLRGRLVLLEAHVNGYRVSARLVSPEDRLALASANERIAWRSLSLYTRSRISGADINEHMHVYRPWLLIADLQPRPIEAPTRHDYFSALALGAQYLTRLAHEHQVAVVVRLTLPLGHGRPNRRELPGQGAYAEAFDTVLLLHRGDDGDESTSATSAEAPARLAEVQVVRHGNNDMAPTHVKLHFDQRYASFVD